MQNRGQLQFISKCKIADNYNKFPISKSRAIEIDFQVQNRRQLKLISKCKSRAVKIYFEVQNRGRLQFISKCKIAEITIDFQVQNFSQYYERNFIQILKKGAYGNDSQ